MLRKTALLMPLLAVVMSAAIAPNADAAERRNDQAEARAQMMAGKVKSIRSIENRILPKMAGSQYIGPEYDPGTQIYRLKFIRKGRVIFIDVDGRTGAILRRRR